MMASKTTPLHLWAVGLLAIIFNGFGVHSYAMTKAGDMAYFQANAYSPEQIDFYQGYPDWAYAIWALSTFGGLLGGCLLLLRKRQAVPFMFIAFSCTAIGMFAQYVTLGGYEILKDYVLLAFVFPLVAFLFSLYARKMLHRGVLA